MMRIKFLIAVILMAGTLAGLNSILTPKVAAYNPFASVCDQNTSGKTPDVCANQPVTDPLTGPGGLILKVVNLISYAIGVASIIVIMLGGLRYIMANGDASNVSAAKNYILYALVGIIVAASAQIIIAFVINRL